jgi:hypothetical protein
VGGRCLRQRRQLSRLKQGADKVIALLAARRASSAKGFCTFVAARRVSARLPSNFLLLAQKKVTKEECPEHQPSGLLASATRLLQRLWLENTPRTTASVTSLRFKHSLSLRLDPVGSSVGVLVPEPRPFACNRSATTKWLVFKGLFLVTFSGPAEKVTRPPGRIPGAV